MDRAIPSTNRKRRPSTTILSTSPNSPFPKFRFSPIKPTLATTVPARTRLRSPPSAQTSTSRLTLPSTGAEHTASSTSSFEPSISRAASKRAKHVHTEPQSRHGYSKPVIVLPTDTARADQSFYLELVNDYDRTSTLIPLRSDSFIWNHEVFISRYSPHYRHWDDPYQSHHRRAQAFFAGSPDSASSSELSSVGSESTPTSLVSSPQQGPALTTAESTAVDASIDLANDDPLVLPANWTVLWTAGLEDVDVHEIRVD
ncbi:hypothetical protein H4R34_001554 [Dimargaris verticillata]|uniref:Uncharacterized protein n=1 Tax=Dimargaris verticillata TaxID=2761393 RepID=A0A9W8BAJ6_9FUNG|nr:hypothetical protein H4R34_001554 [Dimargaris verticillata]